jgi:hypothetical protein
MAKKIYFSRYDDTEAVYKPGPSSKFIPDWYKNAKSYLDDEKKPNAHQTFSTIKRCMPVFDAMTAGYMIILGQDMYCEQTQAGPYFHWRSESKLNSGDDVLTQHDPFQVQGHPENNLGHQLKIENPWLIKTDPGYSCMILPPLHRDNHLIVLSGIVDTDKYYEKINLPFNLKNKNFEGMIEAGTPIAQVIPFKRESYEMEIVPLDKRKSFINQRTVASKLFDAYRNIYWSRKEYK